jgi:ABC-type phosphate transport system permease subunit
VSEIPSSPGPRQIFLFEEPAGRLELFIRIVYSILVGIVMVVYGFLAFLCMAIQFFHVMILGKRHAGLSDCIKGYLEYHVHVLPYTSFMTDRRPGIMPKPVRIFEQE